MRNSRLPRLLRLLTLLQSRRRFNPADLARELEVKERTIYRDLDALRLAGVPLHFDREADAYRINGDFFLPPVQLTFQEAMALSILSSQLGRQRQIPFLESAEQAMNKIRCRLPQVVQEKLAATDGRVRMRTARSAHQVGSDGHYDLIQRSIAAGRKLRCVYDHANRRRDRSPFLFHPYKLSFEQRAWYVIGLSEKRGEERWLKLNRILSLEPTNLPCKMPDGWTLEKSLGLAWCMIRGKPRCKVAVEFDADSARTVADTRWHPTQKITFRPDGSCLFECEVDGLDEITWWILGYGPHAHVLRPDELCDKIRDMIHRTAEKYEEPAFAS
ncbi:MAG: WYL domain-containing protein [Phycisphaerales bacterium]|jgi:predicted DNA-binding transcriptional regulator YafY|nr:WYL domain-containing protein [Phycisphaerales bacterium]